MKSGAKFYLGRRYGICVSFAPFLRNWKTLVLAASRSSRLRLRFLRIVASTFVTFAAFSIIFISVLRLRYPRIRHPRLARSAFSTFHV